MRKPRLVLALVTGAVTIAGGAAAIPAYAGAGGSEAARTPSGAQPQAHLTGAAVVSTTTTAPVSSSTVPTVPVSTTTTAPVSSSTVPTVPLSTTTTEPVAPNYGGTKIRIGVQIADGSYVPNGTTTLGSTLTIVETGCGVSDTCSGEGDPGAVRAAEAARGVQLPAGTAAGDSETTTCTTTVVEDTESPSGRGPRAGSTGPTTETDCVSSNETLAAHVDVGNHVDYFALPGDSVTVMQNTVPSGQAILVEDTSIVVPACINSEANSDCEDEVPAIANDRGLPPVAVNDSATVKAGDAADILVLSNDTSHGAPTSITDVGTPTHGTATLEGSGSYTPPAPSAHHANAAAGGQTILYKPKPGFVGTDTFPYTITTANGTSSAGVTVTVTAPPPAAVNDTATTTSGTKVTIPVTDNDTSHGGGTLVITAVGDPAHGTATVDGDTIVYTPNAGFTGTDSFPYTVKTAFGTATATVTVTIDPAAAAPPAPTATTLPFTGLDATGLGAVAGGLLLAGGGARLVARRRPLTRRQRRAAHRGRH